MTDFLEGVTPQPYGGARDEIEELRDELALALQLKRDYQERAAAAVDDAASLRHQLQDVTRERDIASGNAQMHMEAARDLAVQLEAAQADAERLDFLQQQKPDIATTLSCWRDGKAVFGFRVGGNDAPEFEAIRSAIDHAAAIHKARGTK